MSDLSYPILYSFRRCPYAMRARLALAASNIRLEIREVVLKDKPASMLMLSAKGTVPVLQTTAGEVIDESLDIMLWALNKHDPQSWLQPLTPAQYKQAMALIETNDNHFKYYLDRYKYADRYPEHTSEYYRQQGESFLIELEKLLTENKALLGDHQTLPDMAILPFIRQFAFVDKTWFEQAPYPHLQQWLNDFLHSSLFQNIMQKYPQWHIGDTPTYFG